MRKSLTLYKKNTIFDDFIKGLIKKEKEKLEKLQKKLKEAIDNQRDEHIRKIEKIRKEIAAMGEGHSINTIVNKFVLESKLENAHAELLAFNVIFYYNSIFYKNFFRRLRDNVKNL